MLKNYRREHKKPLPLQSETIKTKLKRKEGEMANKKLTNCMVATNYRLVPTFQLVRTDSEVGTYQSANRYVPI